MTPSPRHILIVEDDSAIREALVSALELDGHATTAVGDGAAAVPAFHDGSFDLVLLDIMLPSMNGYDVCRKIREQDRRVPIIMLTAKADEIDKVLGLELGADDYVTKPFGVRELLARVHAAFRRSENLAPPEPVPPASKQDTFEFGGALIDRRRFTVTLADKTNTLSARELHLIECFFAHPGEVLSRDALLNEVWGIDYLGTTRTLDQHVAQVRKKVEAAGAERLIKTIHGIGYQFVG